MAYEYVQIASSFERDSLERLRSYLTLHGIDCQLQSDPEAGTRTALKVAEVQLDAAQHVLDQLVQSSDPGAAGDDIEIALDEIERTEVVAWLQLLLIDHDRDGSPIFFWRKQYEEALDGLRSNGVLVISVYLVRGLKPFLPPEEQRLLMGRSLQEFFQIVDAVAGTEGE